MKNFEQRSASVGGEKIFVSRTSTRSGDNDDDAYRDSTRCLARRVFWIHWSLSTYAPKPGLIYINILYEL